MPKLIYKYIVDTNVLLRILLEDNKEQCEQIELIFKSRSKFFLLTQVLFEIDYVLRKVYDTEKSFVIKSLESIIFDPRFTIENKEDCQKALEIYRKKKISLVDAYILAKAERLGYKIFTFDKILNTQHKN